MESIYFLIPISLLLLGIGVWAFIWAINHEQFDDLDSPAYRIIYEENDSMQSASNEIEDASK